MNDIEFPNLNVPATSTLSEREWTKLLTLIGEGRLVPVIGPELLCVPRGAVPAARLYDLWGQALAEQHGVEMPPGDEETPLLYRIANRLSVNPDIPFGDLEYDINDLICNPSWPMPLSLLQLAEIDDFPIYLTTTIDHLLETALLNARGTPEAPQVIAFKRGGSILNNDLPSDFIPGKRPVVFHLFGRTCTDRDGFAATEDALIEFSWALIDQDYAPKNLYDFLRKKTLLLLGCNFPDWLDRFFIHALTRKPESQIGVMYVSEYSMGGLHDFLRRKRASLPAPQSPMVFVAELHRRWKQGLVHRPESRACKHGAVFISYAREDRATALAIRTQLETANIDTWMDESGLEPGAEFQEVIRDNIDKASFFLALISRSLNLEGSSRLGRFVLREWKWAEKAGELRPRDHHFLQPVVIDNTPPGAEFVERPFRDLHWSSLKDGALPQEFIDFVKLGIRRFRSQPMGAKP